MAEAKSQQRWAHTSALLAMLANVHRDPKKSRLFKPADFNPHLRRKEPVVARVGISVLKQVFVDRPAKGT
jgi:hypothetical protein